MRAASGGHRPSLRNNSATVDRNSRARRPHCNEANHEEDVVFEQSDAEQIQAFTELFLIYAFTLPERVRLARGTDTDEDT